MLIKHCKQCGIKFKGNAKAQFHSASCRVKFSRNKDVKNLPGYVDSPSQIPEKIKEVQTKVQKRMNSESKGIEFIKGGVSGVFNNGTLIPEEELNVFYRGQRGKFQLAIDQIYEDNFNVSTIVLKETDRIDITKKKKKPIFIKGKKPIVSSKMSYGGYTKQKYIHYETPEGIRISIPLQR